MLFRSPRFSSVSSLSYSPRLLQNPKSRLTSTPPTAPAAGKVLQLQIPRFYSRGQICFLFCYSSVCGYFWLALSLISVLFASPSALVPSCPLLNPEVYGSCIVLLEKRRKRTKTPPHLTYRIYVPFAFSLYIFLFSNFNYGEWGSGDSGRRM